MGEFGSFIGECPIQGRVKLVPYVVVEIKQQIQGLTEKKDQGEETHRKISAQSIPKPIRLFANV